MKTSIATFQDSRRLLNQSTREKRLLHSFLIAVCLLGLILLITTLSVLLKPADGLVRVREQRNNALDPVLPTTTLSPTTQHKSSPSSLPTETELPVHSVRPTEVPTPTEAPSPTEVPSYVSQSPMPRETTPLPSSSPPPSHSETQEPSLHPTLRPSVVPTTYNPGNLTVHQNKLLLSEGLTSKIIAITGFPVDYSGGNQSNLVFHPFPDFGATFDDPGNPDGWIYVSNSEVRKKNFTDFPEKGGVGALTFDKHGNVVDYRMVLSGTEANCGGGRTWWGTWISCEEHPRGVLWQVDPSGQREPRTLTFGVDGGQFESFAYDERYPHFFVTEDAERGALRRFTPGAFNENDPWDILHGSGTTEFLILSPVDNTNASGTFSWTDDHETAKDNAQAYYRNAEGIDVSGNELLFVSKNLKVLFILDLDSLLYTTQSTVNGLFDGSPDQMQRIIDPTSNLVYFTEEGGQNPGVHARDPEGEFFTILESHWYKDETSGLAFSPDGRHMYFAFQESGVLYDITRVDGFPFHADIFNLRQHASTD